MNASLSDLPGPFLLHLLIHFLALNRGTQLNDRSLPPLPTASLTHLPPLDFRLGQLADADDLLLDQLDTPIYAHKSSSASLLQPGFDETVPEDAETSPKTPHGTDKVAVFLCGHRMTLRHLREHDLIELIHRMGRRGRQLPLSSQLVKKVFLNDLIFPTCPRCLFTKIPV